jgi:hypothetical protein
MNVMETVGRMRAATLSEKSEGRESPGASGSEATGEVVVSDIAKSRILSIWTIECDEADGSIDTTEKE